MAPKVIAGAMHAKKTKNEIAIVFWLKFVISARQCVPRVRLTSSTTPWPILRGRSDSRRIDMRDERDRSGGSGGEAAHMGAQGLVADQPTKTEEGCG